MSENLTSSADDEKVREFGFRLVSPVDIIVRNLSVKIDLVSNGIPNFVKFLTSFRPKSSDHKDFKPILNGVGAYMPAGSITAVLGASGSGKTSFLNVLSKRAKDSRLHKSGDILYNGSPALSTVRNAYVMQEDIFLPTLTVRETLFYAAELRLPPPATAEERRRVVEEVILELGLKECADTRVGNNEHKGCSGGEKRRTSLGVQLLANPSILFLDEVTTGLDATSAFQLIKTLKQLASRGRTIVITIHQPRSEIWGLFDRIILLARGGCPIYSGPINGCLKHFSDYGFPVPPFVNPAEHLIDLAAINDQSVESEEMSKARVDHLKSAWKGASLSQPNIMKAVQPVEDLVILNRRTSFIRQTRIQSIRTFNSTLRDPFGVAGSMIQCLLVALFNGWIFFSLDGSLSGIRSSEGALYVASAFFSFLTLIFETYRLTHDIKLFDRERAEGIVSIWTFLISRRIAKFPLEDLPVPLLYSVILYFMAGFRSGASHFFTFFVVLLLNQYLAVTFALIAVGISRDFAGASLVANMNFTLQSICSGFFVQTNQIPVYVKWLRYTAYTWYANRALITNEFVVGSDDPAGFLYDCPYPGGTSNPACDQWTGHFVVASLGFPQESSVWRPIIVMLGFLVAFFITAGIILHLHQIDARISRVRKPMPQKDIVEKEKSYVRTVDEARRLDVTLEGLSLDIEKRSFIGMGKRIKHILKPINMQFKPGTLNVIMGVSGGGKTSLLDLIAGRLSSSFRTHYKSQGTILFGGSIPSNEVVNSVVSYVCQSDHALLSTLTVRETLYFAAELRLPRFMSTVEKRKYAESILIKLGLRDCANTLVGDDLVRGISGGEKRRVSIAIQLLTEPRILLLDEPTSGLDAFTATSILNVIRDLAEEGRTIILTLHQPRSDLFCHFGSVLLLAAGGQTVYAGPGASMLPYFSSLGYQCHENFNPADFALDLISVNLQSSEAEAQSSERLHRLLHAWTEGTSQIVQKRARVLLPAELGSFKRLPVSFLHATTILLRRGMLAMKRSQPTIIARTSQTLGFIIILTLFFAPLKSDFNCVQSRFGLLQEIVGVYFIGMLQNVAVYPQEKTVFYNEYADGAYGVESFFCVYTLMELPFEIVTSFVFGIFAVFACGLPRTGEVYGVICLVCFALLSCGESVGMMFCTFFASTGFAVTMTSVVLSLGLIMSGVLATSLPPILNGINYISPGKWAMGAIAPYTLNGLAFTCEPNQRLPSGRCPIETGEQALDLYNLNGNGGLKLVYLVVTMICYRIIAFLVLKVSKSRWI